MRKKLHAESIVQALVNAVMPVAEARLKEQGSFSPFAAWLKREGEAAQFASDPARDHALPFAEQESRLAEVLRARLQHAELAAAVLVAPVLYGQASSADRSMAVRLHIETRTGYCADILMPYRLRAGRRWRDIFSSATPPSVSITNRVHFSHPVAQESDPILSMGEARAEE